MRFFVGLHQPSAAHHFDASFISVNRLRDRKSICADPEAAFLADAVQCGCDLLSGVVSNVLEVRCRLRSDFLTHFVVALACIAS